MGAPTSMQALLGRRLDIAEQEKLLAMYDRIARRAGRLTDREVEVRRLLKKLQYNRDYVGGRYVSCDDAVDGLLALDAIERKRPLTHVEAERRGELVAREQRWAGTRTDRIAALRDRLALLETLEMAERGAAAEGCTGAEPVELHRVGDGSWTASERCAA